MAQRKRVAKRAAKGKKIAKLEASSGRWKRPRYLPEELAGMYRPVKKPVTLRLDADLVAWFQRDGKQGYQTRINEALRGLMIAAGGKKRR